MSDQTVAVVGATGAVGRTMVSVLAERGFPLEALRLMASERSAGSTVDTRWGEVEVEDLSSADPSGVDIALFSAGGDRSRLAGQGTRRLRSRSPTAGGRRNRP